MQTDLPQLMADAIIADKIAKLRAEARIDDDHMADDLYWASEGRKNRLMLALEQLDINPRDLAEVLQ
ncbi:hypothetical protein TomTYG75_06830 [Sphingobium sp. TomTYG75]